MNKSQRFLRSIVSMTTVLVVFSFAFVFVLGANAASTIGTNMSTTGTFLVNPASNSATSVRFQNAAGTNYLIANSTRGWIGIGAAVSGVDAAPSTVFEVQGTASASYLFTANSLQVLGTSGASASYSRFGIGTTGHSLAAADDVLFAGLVEFNDNAFFDAKVGINGAPFTVFEVQGTASASYLMTANSLQVAGPASVAYSRFGTGTTGYSSDVDATNDLLITGALEVDGNAFFDGKVGVKGAPFTVFEVQGTVSASYLFSTNAFQAGGTFASATASVAYSRFGIGTTNTPGELDAANDLLITGALEVDGKASVAGNFQTSGRFIADTAASHSMAGDLIITSQLTVGAATASASGGTGYTARFVGDSTGTSSFYFGGGDAATLGTCFQLKSSTGAWIYMRFNQGVNTPTLSTVECH